MPRYCPRCGETLHSEGTTEGEVRVTARRAYEPTKKKRKASKWNIHVKKEWAKYKKSYPNGKKTFAQIAKRASRTYRR